MTAATRGFYPAPGKESATSRDAQTGDPAGTPTVVGPDASVEGGIAGSGDLQVRGAVRGRVRVGGDVTVDAAGAVEADVVAGGTVRLEADSRFVGSIHAPRVVIVDGASFHGTIDTGGGAPLRTHDAPPQAGEGPDAGLAAIAVRVQAGGK